MCALMQYLKMLEGNLFKFDTQGWTDLMLVVKGHSEVTTVQVYDNVE